MRKLSLLTFLTFLFTNLLFAQIQFNSENLNVTKSDLEKNTFTQDSTANAVILYEFGNAYIDNKTFDLVFEYKKKIKILNREGFKHSNVSVRLYNSDRNKEKVKKIKGSTTNLVNGKIKRTNLEPSQIFEDKIDENNTYVKFTLPDIKEGSVIIYTYEFRTPFIYKYQPWYFQEEIPKLYSEYITSIPGNYDYHIKLVGDLKLKTHDMSLDKYCIEVGNGGSAHCSVAKYIMTDIPAFREESYMRAASNYLSRIEYELKTVNKFDGTVDNITKSWETADRELKSDQDFGRQLKKSSLVKNLIPESEISKQNSSLKKAKLIYDYVKNNYTWNHKHRVFKDISVKDVIDEKSGNTAEINLLLYNLLNTHDLKVNPILLSTRDHGVVTKLFPVISEFNYLIIKLDIEGKTYFLDATDKDLVFGQIPFKCLNDYGREIDFDNGSKWIDIEPQTKSSIFQKSDITINDDYTFDATISIQSLGYKALDIKREFNKNNQKYKDYYAQAFPDFTFENIDVVIDEATLEVNETITFSGPVNVIGNKVYFDPFIFKNFTENPLKLQERSYPVDFGYEDMYTNRVKIFFSDNFIINDISKENTKQLPQSSALSIFKSREDTGLAEFYFKANFYEKSYHHLYYKDLKSFFDNLVDLQSNSILVLEKKG